ncbi:MAG: Asp-tRNA(Asn)/Glu-tRNA(Gln) amidotransferase subunit GatB [Actinomycetia bacterium]|nr:Asp-tRNA(Asn)/Glu-tRNA(Gln) amidotransferase subunit GatB [Actinomycetes bacterium]
MTTTADPSGPEWELGTSIDYSNDATVGEWETVIGLEVHAELATRTKLFSGAPNQFGSEPNTNIDPVTLGLPGSLPVLNEKAVELAIRIGLALNCSIEPCVFARKNYFYPDMPKDFQISQYDKPLNVEGWLELPSGFRAGIERAHVEEDTGKSTHVGGDGRINDAVHSLVDYNRAGVPLVEIVGRPDLRSADDARAFVTELRSVLVAIGASDGRMEEGSLRVDANVSVRPMGSTELRTRCEVKNVNSLRSLGRAIEYEAARHIDMYKAGERPRQETRHWDEDSGRTTPGRSKEDAEDYRYFPEPDLVPLVPDPTWVEEIRAALPALPATRRATLAQAAGMKSTDVALVVERDHDDIALAAIAAGADGARCVTRLINDLPPETTDLDPDMLAKLLKMESDGKLTATQVKQVLGELAEKGGDPEAIAQALGFETMESDELESVVDQVIADNPDAWERFSEGDDGDRKKMSGFLTGQVMKATRGQADGGAVSRLLAQKVGGS